MMTCFEQIMLPIMLWIGLLPSIGLILYQIGKANGIKQRRKNNG